MVLSPLELIIQSQMHTKYPAVSLLATVSSFASASRLAVQRVLI